MLSKSFGFRSPQAILHLDISTKPLEQGRVYQDNYL